MLQHALMQVHRDTHTYLKPGRHLLAPLGPLGDATPKFDSRFA